MRAISGSASGAWCGPEEAGHWRDAAGFFEENAQRWREQAELWREKAERWQREAEDWGGEAGYWQGEAERLGEENTALRGRVAELEGQVGALAGKVADLSRRLFGSSSERRKPAGASAGGGPDGEGGEDSGADGGNCGDGGDRGDGDGGEGGPARRGRGQRRGERGHGRRDYSGLETEEVVHDLPPQHRACPLCGTAYVRLGEECCEQVDWRVRIVRIVHRRPTYARGCRCPVKGVLAAPAPAKAIAKGRFTNGFLSRLLWEKFALGRPAHRIAAALAADGLAVAEGSLAGVYAALSPLLAPLAQAIEARNAASAHLHADETRWQVFQAVEGKDSHRWWLWVFVGADTTVFRIAPSRSLEVLSAHLGVQAGASELPEGRQLLLSSDFYVVYQSFAGLDGVQPLWCWAHARRRFVRAGQAHPAQLGLWSQDWVQRFAALFAAHQAMALCPPGSEAYAVASAQFDAALADIDAERREQAARPGLHAAAKKALASLDRQWDGLVRHRDFPQLPLDNNSAERALRTPVVGRKNFYGSHSLTSAELAARTWTITATAARAGYTPLAYLTSYLDACAAAGAKPPSDGALARFLPWQANPADQAAWRRPPAGQRPPDTAVPAVAAPPDTAGPAP